MADNLSHLSDAASTHGLLVIQYNDPAGTHSGYFIADATTTFGPDTSGALNITRDAYYRLATDPVTRVQGDNGHISLTVDVINGKSRYLNLRPIPDEDIQSFIDIMADIGANPIEISSEDRGHVVDNVKVRQYMRARRSDSIAVVTLDDIERGAAQKAQTPAATHPERATTPTDPTPEATAKSHRVDEKPGAIDPESPVSPANPEPAQFSATQAQAHTHNSPTNGPEIATPVLQPLDDTTVSLDEFSSQRLPGIGPAQGTSNNHNSATYSDWLDEEESRREQQRAAALIRPGNATIAPILKSDAAPNSHATTNADNRDGKTSPSGAQAKENAALAERKPTALERTDLNGDGVVGRSEFKRALHDSHLRAEVVAQLDKDGDHNISKEEMSAALSESGLLDKNHALVGGHGPAIAELGRQLRMAGVITADGTVVSGTTVQPSVNVVATAEARNRENVRG